MNILSIGSDRSILIPSSESARRQIAYSQSFTEVNIIVFSRDVLQKKVMLAVGVHAYATNSTSRMWYGRDAFRIARRLPKPDIVTVQDPFETGLIGWIIARARRSKFHVQIHTDFLAPEFHSGLNRVRALLARFIVGRADRVRVVSYRMQEALVKKGIRVPITVLPIFVDIPKYADAHPGILQSRYSHFTKRLVVVARLEREKNVMLALESFAKSMLDDPCLIIVGEGRERHALEKRAGKLGITERVFFEGKTDALPYYGLADIVLVPSLFEGYGRVIIEALAAHKPVLATDVGIAREAGAIITDKEHFADALKDWFENGPATGALQHYPYQSFEEYVAAYVADFSATGVK